MRERHEEISVLAPSILIVKLDNLYSYGKIRGYGIADDDVKTFVENYFNKDYFKIN